MEIAETGKYRCSLNECSILTLGKCVNGLAIEECSNKISALVGGIELEDEAIIEKSKTEIIRLPWGKSFEEDEISKITYRYPTKLILLLGEPSCGKSTLYAALFDSFHKGGCGDYLFCSTKTPIGFENICHYAREKCKGRTSKTERTKSYQFTYLHLAVRHKSLQQDAKHLIFADVNGERFQAAKESEDEMNKLTVLKRADHVFFIADGGLLLDDGERHSVKSDIRNLISRCVQNSMFNDNQSVSLVITKWDEINAAGKELEIEEFFIAPTVSKFNGLVKSVLRLASRSINDEVPPRTGIGEFLNICLKEPVPSKAEAPIPALDREYQKFKYDRRL
ncbi:MAG TPA: hypothetical protein VNS58_21440 [Puia sp.]|nr:hypothetical protein [Puia sp.]